MAPIWVSPLSIAVSEDVFEPLVIGIANVPEVDCLEPSFETIWGAPLHAGSPYELLAGEIQAQRFYSAISKAGRDGIGLYAVGTSPTHYGVWAGTACLAATSPNATSCWCSPPWRSRRVPKT